ncbi:MAG TPA: hypothetical protein VK168_02625 [Saprospiraceae bacterium]|nr:hypothetical protein [Saprospiraceae bacterium]
MAGAYVFRANHFTPDTDQPFHFSVEASFLAKKINTQATDWEFQTLYIPVSLNKLEFFPTILRDLSACQRSGNGPRKFF